MSLMIRPAALEDAAAIRRLEMEALGYDCALEMTRRRLEAVLPSPANRVWIAEGEGAVRGFVHAADYDCLHCESLKNILSLAVDGAARRQGVGRALVAAVEGWAKERGCAGVRLVSGMNRREAHRFYEACGYHVRKEQKNFIRLFGEPASLGMEGETDG